MSSLISKYNSTDEFKAVLTSQLKKLENKIDEYSKFIGEKLRTDQEIVQDDPDIQQIKEQMEGPKDPKKKKKKSSRKKNSKWFDLKGLYVYDGAAVTGELEIYFKAIESLKQELENLRKTNESLNSLIEKGLKTNLGCIVLQNGSYPDIVLVKQDSKPMKFKYESIICVPCEQQKIELNGV